MKFVTGDSDEAVVRRVLAGEVALFEVLMRRYNQRLYRVALAIGPGADVEDILQETYLQAFAHLRQFAGKASFATWLTRIAINEALRRRRRGAKFSDQDLAETEDTGTAPVSRTSPEEAMMTQTLNAVLEAAIGRLPDRPRAVFLLREVEGLDTAETAACLGVSPVAVRVRLHRARALLRKDIEAQTKLTAKSLFEFQGARCDRIVGFVMRRLSGNQLDPDPAVSHK